MTTPDWHVTDSYDPEELAEDLEIMSVIQRKRKKYNSADPTASLLLHAARMIRHLMEELEDRDHA